MGYFSEQQIIDICNARINKKLFRAATFTLFIDGTSCTKKTTILTRTKRPVTKIQQYINVKNPDTYFPSTIGYITTGLNTQNCDGPRFNDRSCLNTLEWHILWKIINNYAANIGNVRPPSWKHLKPSSSSWNMDTSEDVSLSTTLMLKYFKIFEALRNAYYYHNFREQFNGIAFIDTNVGRCDELHSLRNEATDRERASWLFYTPLQNLMYKTLYPESYIDMAWFDDITSSSDIIVNGIAKWLTNTLDEITNNCGGMNYPIVPLCQLKLPMIPHDYTLSNINTHMYRNIGRIGCKIIATSNNDKHHI